MGRIDENLIIGRHNQLPFCRRGLLQPTAIRDFAKTAIQEYSILASGMDSPIYTLSGGKSAENLGCSRVGK